MQNATTTTSSSWALWGSFNIGTDAKRGCLKINCFWRLKSKYPVCKIGAKTGEGKRLQIKLSIFGLDNSFF